MPKITFAQTKEFLNQISKKDKILIIHHDDGDGYVAGILLYDWCKNKNAKEYKTSVINFNKAAGYGIKTFDLYYNTAECYGYLNENDSAIIFYKKAYELNKKDEKLIIKLIGLCEKEKKTDIKTYLKAYLDKSTLVSRCRMSEFCH